MVGGLAVGGLVLLVLAHGGKAGSTADELVRPLRPSRKGVRER